MSAMTEDRKRNTSLDEFYGAKGSSPSRTQRNSAAVAHRIPYRAAKLVLMDHLASPLPNDKKLTEILVLAERDRIFCERLQQDTSYQDCFWYFVRLGHRWQPKTLAQRLAQQTIDEAIHNRVALVLAQKHRLGKYFYLLNDADKTRFQREADEELAYMAQWLDESIPGHHELFQNIMHAFALNYEKTHVIQE